MKQKQLALGLSLSLALLCLVGCTPAQTAQPTASAAPSSAKDTVVEITSETTADTIDDMDSGSGEATLYAKNQAGQEVWTHTFTIEAMTELPLVSRSHYGRSCLCRGRRHTVCLVAGRWRRAVGSQ